MKVNLKELQRNFKNHIFNQESSIVRHIVSDALSSEFRLGIYANAYATRLVEVLENDYPVLEALLGEETFYELCHAYITRHPSTYTSLRWFGQQLANFVRESEPYNSKPYLGEMAEFEWTLVDAFNAVDLPAITESDIAQLPPDTWSALGFRFHPSVHSFQYEWNILTIWLAHKERKPLPSMEKLSSPQTCLVWRQELKTLFRTLQPDEATCFTAAQQGDTFSQLCEQLSQWIEDVEQIPLRAAGILKTWVSQQLIAELKC